MSDNDFGGVEQFVELQRGDGSLRAYCAGPSDLRTAAASVVIAMHVWGVDESMRAAARRFADAGFAAIVPDLYARFDAPDGDGQTDYRPFAALAQKLTFETVDPDIRAAADWLEKTSPGAPIAIGGFCMGGAIALRRSYGYGRFKAAAIWYGRLGETNPAAVDIPIVASFGADDAGIPANEVEEFFGRLRVPNDLKVYPNAGHAFCDAARPSYEPQAAEDSWERTIAFLRERLLTDAE